MNNEKFKILVDCVMSGRLNPPEILFKAGYEDWRTRGMVARFLARYHPQYQMEAIDLFKSLIDVVVVDKEEVDLKAWALQELGILVMRESGDAEEAILYTTMALDLSESMQGNFSFVERGNIWRGRLELLKLAGKTEEALQEVDQRIEEFKDDKRNPHSYLYNAFAFKAKIEYQAGHIEEALNGLKQALDYFPNEYWAENELEDIWSQRDDDLNSTYEQMIELTQQSDLSWTI